VEYISEMLVCLEHQIWVSDWEDLIQSWS
jgi:hypothetical protein